MSRAGSPNTSRFIALAATPDSASDWRHQGACRDADPELFFPIGDSSAARLQTEQAKRACGPCPVRDACLTWALDTGQDAGIWGGASVEDRKRMRYRISRGLPARWEEAPEPMIRKVMAKRDLLEELYRRRVPRRQIVKELGIPGLTEPVVKQALSVVRAEWAAAEAEAGQAVAA